MTIAAKSFSAQGSESDGGGGSMPDVATLESLTAQRRQGSENPIQIQYEQETLLVTDQPADEWGRFPKSQRRGLHFFRGELEDVGNTVHDESGHLRVIAWLGLDDQYAQCAVGSRVGAQAKGNPQIIDGHDVSAQIDHSQQTFRAARYLGHRLDVKNFLNPHNLERISFATKPEHHIGLGSIPVRLGRGIRDEIDHLPTFR